MSKSSLSLFTPVYFFLSAVVMICCQGAPDDPNATKERGESEPRGELASDPDDRVIATDGDQDCTFTIGYWKTHHSSQVNRRQAICWPLVIDETLSPRCEQRSCSAGSLDCQRCSQPLDACSENLELCGENWLDILHEPPRGEAWYILAHQWIGAQLNQALGADTTGISEILTEAGTLLLQTCRQISGEQRARAIQMSEALDAFNNSNTGCGPAESVCGDGVVDEGEGCDDGNLSNDDACLNACIPWSCGDRYIYEEQEECDDGDDDHEDECLNTCRDAFCGDAVTHRGVEECDDGDEDQTDACLSNCKIAKCGDGFVWSGFEECDDGNLEAGDGCDPECDIEPACERDEECGPCQGCSQGFCAPSPLGTPCGTCAVCDPQQQCVIDEEECVPDDCQTGETCVFEPICDRSVTRPEACEARTLAQDYDSDARCHGTFKVIPAASLANKLDKTLSSYTYQDYVECDYGRLDRDHSTSRGVECPGNGRDYQHLLIGGSSSEERHFIYDPDQERFEFRTPCDLKISHDVSFTQPEGPDEANLILEGINTVKKIGKYQVDIQGDLCLMSSNERNQTYSYSGDVQLGGEGREIYGRALYMEGEREVKIASGTRVELSGSAALLSHALAPDGGYADSIIEDQVEFRAETLIMMADQLVKIAGGSYHLSRPEGLRMISTQQTLSPNRAATIARGIRTMSTHGLCMEGRIARLDSERDSGVIYLGGVGVLVGTLLGAEIQGHATIFQLAGAPEFSLDLTGCTYAKIGRRARVGTKLPAQSCEDTCQNPDPDLVSPAKRVSIKTVHTTLGASGEGVQQSMSAAICAREEVKLDAAIHNNIAVEVTNHVSEGDWIARAGRCGDKGRLWVNVDPVEICAAERCLFETLPTLTTDQGPSIKIARTTQVVCGGEVEVLGHSHDGRVEISSSGRDPKTRLESLNSSISVQASGRLHVKPDSIFLAPQGSITFTGRESCEIEADQCSPDPVMLDQCSGLSCGLP